LLPERQVCVRARLRPFSQIADTFYFPEGTPLADMAAAIPFPEKLRPVLKCQVNGDPIPATWWKGYRPKPGTAVIIVPVPEGGGGLRIALTVAVIAAAIAAPYAAPAFMGAGTLGGALLSASITIAGMMAINALIPPEVPQLASSSTVSEGEHYAIEGASNRARMKGPVMQVLGRHRIFPDLAAQSYSEYDGDDQYFNMLLDLGYGPLELSDPRIGERDLSAFDDVDTQLSSGIPGEDQEVDLFPYTVLEDSPGQELRKADGWITFTTKPNTGKIGVDIGFRRGLGRYHRDGDFAPSRMELYFRYAPTGTDDWSEVETREVNAATGKPMTRSFNFKPAGGRDQYDIQVSRGTGDNDSNNVMEQTWVEVIRSMTGEQPVRNKFCQLYALRIRASRQLSGRINDFSVIATTICPDYKSSQGDWDSTPTQNPASLFRHVLQSYANENRVDDDEIDLTTLEYWHGLCEYYNWTCNYVVDKDISTWDLLRIVASTGRALPMQVDGKWTVCIDEPKTTDEFHLTPRNCRNLRWRKIFAKRPHALRVSFVDEESNYKERTRDVYDDGFDEDNATRYEDWEMPGVTRPDLVYKHARKRLAEIKLRPEQYEVELDWEWLTFMRGSKGRLSYDTVLVGSGFGRIKEIDGADLVLDEKIVWDGTGSLVARVRCADGSSYVSPIANWSGENSVLTRVGDDDGDGTPAVGDMVMVGVDGRESMEVLVTGIRPGPELSATVTLVPYAEGVFNAEDGPIPAWDPLITEPREAVAPTIDLVTSSETALVRDADGSHKLAMVVNLRRTSQGRSHTVTGLQMEFQEVSTGAPAQYRDEPAEARQVTITNVRKGVTYDLRARYRLGNNKRGQPQYGGWSAPVTHTVLGPDIAPSDVAVVYVAGDRISWLKPALVPPDHEGYLVKFTTVLGQNWEAAEELTDGIISENYVLLQAIPTDAVELLVKAVTRSFIESATAGRALVAGVPRPTAYRVFIRDLAAESFPTIGTVAAQISWTTPTGTVDWTTPTGTVKWRGPTSGGAITGAEVEDGVLQATDSSEWLGPPDGDWLSPPDADWLAGNYASFTWEFDYVCPSNVRSTDYLLFERLTEGELRIAYAWATDQVSQYADNLLPPRAETLPPRWVPLGFYLSGSSGRPFVPWRDGLRPIAGEVIRFRVVGRGGTATRARILAAKVIVMGAQIVEELNDFTIPSGGTRLPLASAYRGIEWITSHLDDSSAASTVRTVDKNVSLGPLVRGIDEARQDASAIGDFRIGGY
jgi:hypothetical protein